MRKKFLPYWRRPFTNRFYTNGKFWFRTWKWRAQSVVDNISLKIVTVSSSFHFLSIPFGTGHLTRACRALPGSYPESWSWKLNCQHQATFNFSRPTLLTTESALIVVSSREAARQPSSGDPPTHTTSILESTEQCWSWEKKEMFKNSVYRHTCQRKQPWNEQLLNTCPKNKDKIEFGGSKNQFIRSLFPLFSWRCSSLFLVPFSSFCEIKIKKKIYMTRSASNVPPGLQHISSHSSQRTSTPTWSSGSRA